MNWWLIFGSIVVFAMLQTVLLLWWLWRRARALAGALGVLAQRATELADILSEISAPPDEPGTIVRPSPSR
ncbi:MAG TPA: hypothetical protein GXZ30_08300 [Propionibacterium sp.]|nr:hypothetical protein [Propionibacterium sp.]